MSTNRTVTITACVLLASIFTSASSAIADEQEAGLLEVLRSDAPNAEKAMTCKELAIHGSDAAVPELAKLLPDPQLSSWSRIALEAIPGEAADNALQNASESLEGELLVGTINSIGVRRIEGAVDSLSERLSDGDPMVASAAAVALGRIGNADATHSLQQAMADSPATVRNAVAEGYVLCAERLLAAGESDAATNIYEEIRNADVPMQRIVEATRGSILARGQDGIPLLLEAFRSPDKKLFQLALGTAREFPGSDIDKVLAEELDRTAPKRAALILQAMADRHDTVVLAAVLKAAKTGDRQVRLSAIEALQRVGDVSCLPTLLDVAIDDDADLAQAAQNTLAELPGESVDAKIVALLPAAKANSYPLLIELVGQRRIDALPDLMKALNDSNSSVRRAALVAMGETVPLDKLSLLVSQVVAPKHSEDAAVAMQALKAASVRMPDREACALELAIALQQSPTATKGSLLEIISSVGGSKALETLATSAKSPSPELQDAGSRLLGKWNSVDAAPVLLDLASTAPAEKYRVRALRGYIGLARKFSMPEPERAEMCQQALAISNRLDEKKLVLDVLKIHPSIPGLELAIDAKQEPGLANDAKSAAMLISQKLSAKGVDVTKLLSGSGLDKVKLEIIKAQYGAGDKMKDVTNIVRKRAGNQAMINLGSNFNASLGGDPAPGTVKRLKIQYRMNGKLGEATFPENAVILLPATN